MAYSMAMYYPWQDISDRGWLKSCLLYWDEIHTLVPTGDLQPYKSPETQIFAECGALVPSYPTRWDVEDSNQRLSALMRTKEWADIIGRHGDRTLKSIEKLRLAEPYDPDPFPMWSSALEEQAPLGIKNWDRVDRNVATLYLTTLAVGHAKFGAWALVTNQPGLRALAESIRVGFPLSEAVEAGGVRLPPTKPREVQESAADVEAALGMRFTLKSMQIDPATPPEKIIAFREKYRDELGNFRTRLSELAFSAAGEYPSYAAFEQTVADIYRNSIEPSVSAVDRALRSQQIVSRLSMLSVSSLASVPAMLSHIPGPVGATIGIVADGSLALTVQMAKSRAKVRAIESGSPYSYVVHAKADIR